MMSRRLSTFDPLTGDEIRLLDRLTIYPKTHFVMPRPRLEQAVETIKDELKGWETLLEQQGRLLEAQRIHQRTLFDLEMIKEIGYCHGIENYSRHFTGRLPGQPPPTSAGLPAAGLADVHRREPSDDAATARDVPRGSVAQGEPRRIWIPAAIRDGQSAADF